MGVRRHRLATDIRYIPPMRAVVQRVRNATVTVGDRTVGSIGHGLLVLVGVASGDDDDDADVLARKLAGLRVFADEEGKTNRSLLELPGAVLVVSQFTLLASTRKGRRPSFTAAASPEAAAPLVGRVVERLRESGLVVETGAFGEQMSIELVNDGPFTLVIDVTGGAVL